MRIDLKEIYSLQKELDFHIHQEHNVEYKTILPELKLALFTELAECANEVRCFKFWSLKKPSEKNVILEEYVDGIHFITSLGIFYNIDSVFDITTNNVFNSKREITNGFNNLFAAINQICDKDTCYEWYKNYLCFGLQLNFTIEEIISAYKKKCEINHRRQDNKY